MSKAVIFDLDRTLTRRGCFTPFIFHVAKTQPRRFLSLPRIFLAVICNILGFYTKDKIKLLMWRKVVSGLPRKKLEDIGAAFGTRWAQNELRAQTTSLIRKHQESGDTLILATAAMDVIAIPFGKILGFDEIICTRTKWTRNDLVSPAFDGKNCYGKEKLRRVKLFVGDLSPSKIIAYSDHITDLPLLLWAKDGVAVNPHRPLRDAAAHFGLRIEDWN
jgi:phosphatidylglycerophosphatase C